MNHIDTINHIKDISVSLFQDNLTGIYLHGSVAFGCYNSNKSDIDLIVVTDTPPANDEKVQFIKAICQLSDSCCGKGIELSIILSRHCNNFVYPTPYELHYSITHEKAAKEDPIKYCQFMKGTDKDLAAHFTVIHNVGKCIYGMPIKDVFGDVAREHYIDSIMFDLENAYDDIMRDPVYVILNLCRTACYFKYDKVLSKKDGGLIAKNNIFTEYSDIISKAVNTYCSDVEFKSIDKALLKAFAYDALEYIKKQMNDNRIRA